MVERFSSESPVTLEDLRVDRKAAFAELVRQLSPRIFRTALRMLDNEQDAEDAMQETFLKALRSLDRFEGRSSLSTWIYRIAMNEILMSLRKRKFGVVSIDEEVDAEEGVSEPVEITDWCCLPENELLDGEAKAFLDKAVNRLSPVLRAVFILRDMEGLSVLDTAGALNISEAAVKTRNLRARMQLREELSKYYGNRTQA